MKTLISIKHIAALLLAGLSIGMVFAQSSEPAILPVLPVTEAPANPPALVTPPTTPEPPATAKPKTAEGTLFKSQRVAGDKGGVGSDWVCTYRVAGASKSVQLSESCPDTMRFELKR